MFDIQNVAFTLFGHPVSMLELTAVCFNLASVWLATRANILTWIVGIMANVFLAALFVQLHLYADMFLQIFFAGFAMYGYGQWKANPSTELVREGTQKERYISLAVLIGGTVLVGALISHVHQLLPNLFSTPAAHSFTNSAMVVMSILATFWMSKKVVDFWLFWIAVNVGGILVYYSCRAYFLTLEYCLFLLNACYGYYSWNKLLTKSTYAV